MIKCLNTLHTHPNGFNGAADLHRRKFIGACVSFKNWLLQWGRGLTSAEIPERANCQQEPRRLQWGRGLTSAEIFPPSAGSTRLLPRFNGAADLHPRKCCYRAQTRTLSTCFNGAADLHP